MDFQMTFKKTNTKVGLLTRLRGLISILIAYIAIHYFPLETICKVLKFLKSSCSHEITIDQANIAWSSVRQSNFLFGRLACLELSLSFFIFCLTQGLAVTWCIGVIDKPFRSHAWIEIDGKPFQESESFDYKTIMTV